MASYFVVVNRDKKQFVDPTDFADNPNSYAFGSGYHAMALASLCVETDYSPGEWHPLIGSWVGDRILLVPSRLAAEDEDFSYDGFENISIACLSMLCNWHEQLANELVSRLPNPVDDQWLVNIFFLSLGEAAALHNCRSLELALTRQVEGDWESKYHDMRKIRESNESLE